MSNHHRHRPRRRARSYTWEEFAAMPIVMLRPGEECPICAAAGIHHAADGGHETVPTNSERAGVEHPTLSAITTDLNSEDHISDNDS